MLSLASRGVITWWLESRPWEIREERQQNAVADDVTALIAVTRPIINGVLQSIRGEMIDAVGHSRQTSLSSS